MASKKDETASFVLRFTQKVFQNDQGDQQVQWRGNIRHVQGGDEKRFSEFEEVVKFIQAKLADLTIIAMEDKSPEEQKGILAKSFDLWKRMAVAGPKMVMETLKDPKAGVEHIQEQVSQAVQEQVGQVEDLISNRIDTDAWKPATKADLKTLMQSIAQLSQEVAALNGKLDKISNKTK
ncbi:MAG TPA: hypothetical protein ENJ95_10020 [Bacteroidetes bacterium]|nr:hypothetical protein [Bacteroidota bacterium]